MNGVWFGVDCWGLGFGVTVKGVGSGFGVHGFGFIIWGLGFGVWDLGITLYGLWLKGALSDVDDTRAAFGVRVWVVGKCFTCVL